MHQTQYNLLKRRRFLPLFATQFCNAFNDNVFRNALVMLIMLTATQDASFGQCMIALIGGVFILPFFLFSALAGQVADKFEKTTVIQNIKLAEIIFMVMGSMGFHCNNLFLLMATLFCLGTHSTFLGPIKYAILPQQLQKNELIEGNALIEAGTFMAILLGQILGSSLLLAHRGVDLVGVTLVSIAVAGWASSWYIPPTKRAAPDLVLSFNLVRETWRIITITRRQRDVSMAILGISWFWFVGATFIAQFPLFVKEILHTSTPIFTFFLTIFTLGVGAESLLCNKLIGGSISLHYVPASILAMSVFITDIYLASFHSAFPVSHLLSVSEFFSVGTNIRITVDVFLMTLCAGLYIVPLYALMQVRSKESVRSRIIAANNMINSLFMVGSTLFVMLAIFLGLTIPQLFLVLAMCNGIIAVVLRSYCKTMTIPKQVS